MNAQIAALQAQVAALAAPGARADAAQAAAAQAAAVQAAAAAAAAPQGWPPGAGGADAANAHLLLQQLGAGGGLPQHGQMVVVVNQSGSAAVDSAPGGFQPLPSGISTAEQVMQHIQSTVVPFIQPRDRTKP